LSSEGAAGLICPVVGISTVIAYGGGGIFGLILPVAFSCCCDVAAA